MNTWQLLRQLKYLLTKAVWSDPPAERVFPTAIVSTGPERDRLAKLRIPLIILTPGMASNDPEFGEAPNLVRVSISALILTSITGDGLGEFVIMGGVRSGGLGSSKGKGILELEEEMFKAVLVLNELNGVRILHVASTAASAVNDPEYGYNAWRQYTFDSWVTGSRFYHPVTRLSASGGGGTVTLTWTNPPDRFDRFRIIVMRTTGATPPVSVTDPLATRLTLASDLPTSHVDTIAGTHSYAVFVAYDEKGDPPATEMRFSAGVTVSGVVS